MRPQILDLDLCSIEELPEEDFPCSSELEADASFHAPPPARGQIREELLAQVRARLKKGYYSSQEVINGLSEDFARAFNEKP